MGYRSDVAIGIGCRDRGHLAAVLARAKMELTDPGTELGCYVVSEVADGLLLHAEFSDIKWYDEYPEVQYHTALLSLATDMDCSTVFARIGEELDDIEFQIDNVSDEKNGLANGFDMFGIYEVARYIEKPEGGKSFAEFMKQEEHNESN